MNKKLAQGSIATTPGTLAYTVPKTDKATYITTVTCIDIANTTAGALTLTLHLVPVGIAVGASNTLIPTISIAANSVYQWRGWQVLNTGDFIQAIGSGAGLTMNISGDVIRKLNKI